MSKRLTYIPALDSLRGVAALLVLTSHFLLDLHGPGFSVGANGVQIFFVISGFLITGILLSQKYSAISPKLLLIRNFIIKRALRLFPLYYVFILILFGFSLVGGLWLCEKNCGWYYFTYTQNWLFFLKGFQSPLLNHTWSLAVEEQFYLLWPFLILFIPRRAELPFLLVLFIGGVLCRPWMDHLYPGRPTVHWLTFMNFDTLGCGALLAWVFINQKTRVLRFLDKFALPLFGFFLTIYVLMAVFGVRLEGLPVVALASGLLTYICLSDKITLPGIKVIPELLRRVGKISYGVYLLHKPVPFFFTFLYSRTGLSPITNILVLFFVYLAITLVLATLSWHLFEKRILALKERFDA